MALRSPLLHVFKVLTLLNQFYSLRDLEALLGVPFQSLWRYLNLVSIPRRSTVDKILRRAEELKLVDKLVDEVVNRVGDVSALSGDPRFLRLFSAIVSREITKRIDIVVPLSLEAIPLATVLALETGSTICYLYSHEARSSLSEHYIVAHYVSRSRELKFIAIPKSCLRPRSRVALVDTVLDDQNKVSTVIDLLRKRMCVPTLLIAIASEEDPQSIAQKHGVSVKVLRSCRA